MSSLALMRWLESAPSRYDRGMRLITLGRVDAVRAAVAHAAVGKPGAHVLDIGCGTGALTELLLDGGARVTAVDQNPELLELARAKLASVSAERLALVESTASEIDDMPEGHFDAVAASFSLCEMSHSERHYVLTHARRCLAPGGVVVVGDELRPRSRVLAALHALLRVPQALLGWLMTGSVSRPIAALDRELREAGFRIRDERRWLAQGLGVIVAEPAP
jgi:ubiquinone/menaquinone biosynthesis C-methylase UbiE